MPSDSDRMSAALRQVVATRAKNYCEFGWSNDFTQAVGITPCGRATINALALNRQGVINLRRLLTSAGLHPPS